MTTSLQPNQNVMQWLLDSDPAIRWQVMRDLQKRQTATWSAEQARVASEGWGKRLLDLQAANGTWGHGIYSPKWTSTTYTLLLLADVGLPRGTPAAVIGTRIIYDAEFSPRNGHSFGQRLASLDLCVTGMDLRLACYFGLDDPRIEAVLAQLFAQQMPDGGWNCKRKLHRSVHASVHTTINVLEGLAEYVAHRAGPRLAQARKAIERAEEFLLLHRLYKSHRTGAVMRKDFTEFSFPPRWHYDALRALDYFARYRRPRDPRHGDAIALLQSQRTPDGRWKLRHRHRGAEAFALEKVGQPSRWITLRALRVLQWWGEDV